MSTEDTKNLDNNDAKVTFTPEQQEVLNQIVEKRLARSNKEAKAELETAKTERQRLEAELAEAKETLSKAAKGSTDAKNAQEDIESVKNELDEVKRSSKAILNEREELKKQLDVKEKTVQDTHQQMLELRKQTAMNYAAQKLPFVDLEAVIVLTEKYIKYDKDTDSFSVVNDKGAPRFNPVGDPLGLDEFYTEYAQQKKHLVRSDALSGVGSAESKNLGIGMKGFKLEDCFGPKSDSKKAAALHKADPVKYATMRKEAVALGWLK
jgi:myosin heavy subunit